MQARNIKHWIVRHASTVALIVALLFLNLFSLPALTTKPAFWYDEGINVELARNFAEFGALDLVIAPGTFSGEGQFVGSTGYPVTLSLAGIFKVFGFGFEQARLMMLFWMNALVILVFYFSKRRWGSAVAICTALLLVTYPPFYGNGRSVMGEIPGFLFLILALSFFLDRRNALLVGFLAGLAVITKPSVYIFALPAFAVLSLFSIRPLVRSFRSIVAVVTGALFALVPWVLIYGTQVFSETTWFRIADHFRNPYAAAGLSVLDNITANLATFFSTGTLLYMTLFAFIVASAALLKPEWRRKHALLLFFIVLMSIGGIFFYLKSAGYLRYLIALQLLLIIAITPAIFTLGTLIPKQFRSVALSLIIGGLLLFQGIYLFTGAKLYQSRAALDVVLYVEEHFPGATYATVNVPTVASLLPPERKYAWISTYGLMALGTDPKTLPEQMLPDVIIIVPTDVPTYANLLERNYTLLKTYGDKVVVYALRTGAP